MSMPRFDINAYNKLNDAFNYAQELKTSRTVECGRPFAIGGCGMI